ncbi:hypothetical protein MBLNU13_g10993t1 [Cladosporium sp. NU13]
MSSSQSQLPAAKNAAEIAPGTWAAIMEERRTTNPDRLICPYIPIEDIPRPLHRWHRFCLERVPPGFVEGNGIPFFHRPQFEELVRRRRNIAERMKASTGLPYRFNFENGRIELPPDVQVVDSRLTKRKRDLSPSPASFSSARQVTPRGWAARDSDCLFPSPENMEFMECMRQVDRRDGRSSTGESTFGVRLPPFSHEQRSEQSDERRSQAPCQPPGPGSSRTRSQRGSKGRSDSVGNEQPPQPRSPKPPDPLYPRE